jgi:hypothetical protein
VCEPGNLDNLGISVNLDSNFDTQEIITEIKETHTAGQVQTTSVMSEEEGFRILKEEGY